MIKLNLGCGNKLKEGYINVDIATRDGKQPDVDADVRDLPFHENYADEILSVHVVEHFFEWEIQAILKEWLRVLKPGGKIIIECPDMIKACWHVVNAVTEQSHMHPQLTMWPLYGDPGHKDPLMMHKTGWWPSRLGMIMKEVGFTGIEEKDAQFHMGPIRDMRLEATKE